MNDFSKILDKAKELEEKMKESQQKIKNITVEGTSGTGSVKVTLNGNGEMLKIFISPDTLNEEKSIIEDLITAAHNNAKEKLKKLEPLKKYQKQLVALEYLVLNGHFKKMQNISEIEDLS